MAIEHFAGERREQARPGGVRVLRRSKFDYLVIGGVDASTLDEVRPYMSDPDCSHWAYDDKGIQINA